MHRGLGVRVDVLHLLSRHRTDARLPAFRCGGRRTRELPLTDSNLRRPLSMDDGMQSADRASLFTQSPSAGSELLITPSSCANAREDFGRGVLISKVRDSWLAIRQVQGRNG